MEKGGNRRVRRRSTAVFGILACCVVLPFLQVSQSLAQARTRDRRHGATARVPPSVVREAADPTASMTSVEVPTRVDAMRGLDDYFREIPGARSRRLGFVGAPTTLSLRGANAEHTAVLLDTIPLGSADGATFDLSNFPVAIVGRVEAYRGGVPFELGVSPIGGAIRLIPRVPAENEGRISLSGGSFGTLSLDASASIRHGDFSWLGSAGFTHTNGDYPYNSDNDTPFDSSDDTRRERVNADLDDARAFLFANHQGESDEWRVIIVGSERNSGAPGPAVEPTRFVRRNHGRALAAITYRTFGEHTLDATIAVSGERARFRDRFNEVGLQPKDTDDSSLRLFGRVVGSFAQRETLSLNLLGSYALESFRPVDGLAPRPLAASLRHHATFGLEGVYDSSPQATRDSSAVVVQYPRLQARAQARLEVLDTMLNEVRSELDPSETHATTLAPTGRVGLHVEAVEHLSFNASLFAGTRPPSLFELFGDRGFTLGDVRLKPETGTGADVSVVGRAALDSVRVSFEARGFATRFSDLIVHIRTAQYTTVPRNLGEAWVYGTELGASVSVGPSFRTVASFTWMESDIGEGRKLPLRPRLSFYVRPEVTLRFDPCAVSAFVDLSVIGANFVDTANIIVLRERAQVGLGAELTWDSNHWALGARVSDVLDWGGTDVIGFPLAGRAFVGTLSWTGT